MIVCPFIRNFEEVPQDISLLATKIRVPANVSPEFPPNDRNMIAGVKTGLLS
jgi:hypothetical protein